MVVNVEPAGFLLQPQYQTAARQWILLTSIVVFSIATAVPDSNAVDFVNDKPVGFSIAAAVPDSSNAVYFVNIDGGSLCNRNT